jgi:hypothetical protein
VKAATAHLAHVREKGDWVTGGTASFRNRARLTRYRNRSLNLCDSCCCRTRIPVSRHASVERTRSRCDTSIGSHRSGPVGELRECFGIGGRPGIHPKVRTAENVARRVMARLDRRRRADPSSRRRPRLERQVFRAGARLEAAPAPEVNRDRRARRLHISYAFP